MPTPARRIAAKADSAPSTKKPQAKRQKVDWDAVERDYRTGKFTLRELEAKHGVDNAQIARRKKKEGWAQDLTEAVRQATNARLMTEIVSKEVSAAQQSVSTAVLAVAEVNAQVILRHRARLAQLAQDADAARAKLLAMTELVSDVREASTLVSAIEACVRTEKILIDQERRANRIDDDAQDDEPKEQPTIRVEYVGVGNA